MHSNAIFITLRIRFITFIIIKIYGLIIMKKYNSLKIKLLKYIMHKRICFIIIAAICIILFSNCKGNHSNYFNESDCDSVAISTITQSDTVQFKAITGDDCIAYINANITYPTYFKDEATLHNLNTLFFNVVLESQHSGDITQVTKNYISTLLKQYGVDESEKEEHVELDYKCCKSYGSNIDIAIEYNRNGILTFSKACTTLKDRDTTLITHEYFNFDLFTMKYITLDDVVSHSCIDNVTSALKEKLIKDNNVVSEDELINLGYYNIDNLKAHNNFRLTNEGIIWSFLPYEIALLIVGETEILLTYDELEPYILKNCDLISRIN